MPALTAAAVPVHTAVKAGGVDTPALIALDKAARVSAVEAIISRLQNDGPTVFNSISLAQGLLAAIGDKKNPLNREAAVSAIHLLASKGAAKHLEPYILGDATTGLFPALLEAFADKTPAVRALAVDAVLELVRGASPWATAQILPPVLTQIKSGGKWQVKIGCLLESSTSSSSRLPPRPPPSPQISSPSSPRLSGTPRPTSRRLPVILFRRRQHSYQISQLPILPCFFPSFLIRSQGYRQLYSSVD
jgi:elongation factor 3